MGQDAGGTGLRESPKRTSITPMKSTSTKEHRFSFYRAGGVDQVRLDDGEDILNLDQLDQKLWVALSCPVSGLEFDKRTLELLDSDGDLHVRPPEILATCRWLRLVLKSANDLVAGKSEVSLANIRTDTEEGRALLASAERALVLIDAKESRTFCAEDAVAAAGKLDQAEWNGDGVVPPDVIKDAADRAVAEEIVTCLGGVADRSGKTGINQDLLDQFFEACAAFDTWVKAGEADAKGTRPFGAETESAVAAMDRVQGKIDDYFARCRLAAFDARALTALNREEKDYFTALAGDISLEAKEVAHFPISGIAPGKPLDLRNGVNPAWAGALDTFRTLCLAGKESLEESAWVALRERVAGHRAWLATKAGCCVESLGIARVRAILAGKSKAGLKAAIDHDLSIAPEIDGLTNVEKLGRLQAHFHRLLNNYVSFTDFYARRGAIFQAGTLHLDGRELDLCFHVNDGAKHTSLAAMAKIYLAYVDCKGKNGETMQVACAFTAGDKDNLFVGRNGIFYDRQGRDWDATINKIIDNPISVRQAFWSPYKKVLRWIEEAAAKRAAAADEAATAKLHSAAASAGEAAAGAEPKKSKFDVGVVAALGVAVGGITAALTGLLDSFFGLGPWIPLGILGLILAISGPSMILAWFKLRQRNLGPILDANGWAVNSLTRINLPLGGSLTSISRLPEGAKRSLADPYAPKRSIWPRLLLALMLLGGVGFGLYRYNFLHQWFPDHIPAYISASFDGPEEITAGTAEVELTLGSGASSVTVTVLGKDKAFTVPVENHRVKIPCADLVPGDRAQVTDIKTGKTHMISVVAPK
jgi:hypothetical protein